MVDLWKSSLLAIWQGFKPNSKVGFYLYSVGYGKMGVAHSFSSGSVCVVTYSLPPWNAMSFFVALYFTIYQIKIIKLFKVYCFLSSL